MNFLNWASESWLDYLSEWRGDEKCCKSAIFYDLYDVRKLLAKFGTIGTFEYSTITSNRIIHPNYSLPLTSLSILKSMAHLTASLLPLCTSTPNQIVRLAAAQITKIKGNPFQLLPLLSIIAWTTFGPITLEARFESPKSPKNILS